jgi:parallel beta-helix repeat protein
LVTNCILTGNTANYEGGGVSVGTLTHCTLARN